MQIDIRLSYMLAIATMQAYISPIHYHHYICSPLPTKNTSTIDAHMSYQQNSSFSAKDQVNRL